MARAVTAGWLLALGLLLAGSLAIALLLRDVPFRDEGAPRSPRHGPAYRVLRVVDGDTIVLSIAGRPTTVRLIGVDAPELERNGQRAEPYARESRLFLVNLLAGESAYLDFEAGSSRDRYGRTLAYVLRAPDGLDVNVEIVRQGYGAAYTRFPFDERERFLRWERAARTARKGVWGRP